MIHYKCSACERDFSNLGQFDLHRESWYLNQENELVGSCTDPSKLGLSEVDGTWWSPEGLARRELMKEIRLTRR